MKGAERFRKEDRLRKRAQFVLIQSRGFKVHSEHLLALAVKGGGAQTRVGFTVSSKVGGAVVRNRVRRCLREWFRKSRGKWPAGLDVVVIAKPSAAQAPSSALGAAMVKLGHELTKRQPSIP